MRLLRIAVVLGLIGLGLWACGGTRYDDTGRVYPGQWWPWVCSNGGAVPDGGCPLPPACPDGGASDGGC